mmetsp:Transcript_22908/g.49729  ORF Transcript_22908/g.49729 Transcript_22908/m.49729 type:complete len:94 (-) Transcript_22908:23-304(-)
MCTRTSEYQYLREQRTKQLFHGRMRILDMDERTRHGAEAIGRHCICVKFRGRPEINTMERLVSICVAALSPALTLTGLPFNLVPQKQSMPPRL